MSDHTIEMQYLSITNSSSWSAVFEKIALKCKDIPCIEAKKHRNRPFNRYRDVNPYDHSRIVLRRSKHDYINANLVNMRRASRRYILTQGPLSVTVEHFWLMIWEQNTRAILMLNRLIEKNENKCTLYWPDKTGDDGQLQLHNVKLTVKLTEEEDFIYFIIRRFELIDEESGDARQIVQYHYTTWPDFGVPSSPDAFLNFLYKVRESGCLENDVGPAVIHCSAGIGRSGTFCLVDSCLVIIEKEGTTNIDVQEILLEMRKDRMGLIQTPDQLHFSYLAIIEGAKRLDPTYEPVMNNHNQDSPLSPLTEYEEESPPPPPPRSESLTRAPNRALPDIPTGDDTLRTTTHSITTSKSFPSTDDEEYKPAPIISSQEKQTELRHRKKDPLDRVTATIRKEDRQSFLKKKLCNPITLTVGVIITGLLVYAFVKR